jgi:hypothetical protein
VDECANNVGEVGQFFKIADGVPVGRLDPIIRINRLCLSIDTEIGSTLKEEVVLLLVDLF